MLGIKVVIDGKQSIGFAEIASYPDADGNIEITYYNSPVDSTSISTNKKYLKHSILPNQTRCFVNIDDHICYGRIIICRDEKTIPRKYYVKLPNERDLKLFSEEEFHVQAYLKTLSPVEVLAEFAQETPFFFQHRHMLLSQLLEQDQLCFGITGLASAKIEFFDHQVEVARRVLQDPVMRYLLADEVGLGKTIEAGIIMRQVRLDWPDCTLLVFVPKALVSQWHEELDYRFGLGDIQVLRHEEILDHKDIEADLLVIDEAHRVVATGNSPRQQKRLYEATKNIAKNSRNLLLLSATPILHRDAEMLSLLHLLDPQAYKLNDRDSFSALLQNRQNLGRAFLAFIKSSLPALVKRNASKLEEHLPNDHLVKELVSQIKNSDGDQIHIPADALRAHISESYRIHRRMIRTRRSWLIEDFGLGERRVRESGVEYELNENVLTRLWERLEDWRIEMAASPAAKDEHNLKQLIDTYISFAEAIASDHDRLHLMIEKELRKYNDGIKQEILREMLSSLNETDHDEDRISLLCRMLKGRLRRDDSRYKYVIFCSGSKNVLKISERLANIVEAEQFLSVYDELSDEERDDAIAHFRDDPTCRLLLADSVMEEGANLQFAEGLVLYDLPWNPMRIEQRLGRLDRINRVREIPCRVILSLEDDGLALDQAWYRVLTDGFGVYENSLSDLQFLLDKKLPELKSVAFWGGPSALVETIPSLKETIREERERIAEQDVIDGLHLTGRLGSELRESLDNADLKAKGFSKALKEYLEQNLKFRLRSLGQNSFCYRLKDDEPLLPLFRLETLMRRLSLPSTHDRDTSLRDLSLELLRPGNGAIEACRSLLSWDHRGRAFALWRQKMGIVNPIIIFRISFYIRPAMDVLTNNLRTQDWSPLARSGLLRLIRSWMPEHLFEIFMDESGKPVPADLREVCSKEFNNSDKNLGGKRSTFLKELVGVRQWRETCETIADRCSRVNASHKVLINIEEKALHSAHQHFNLLAAQLEVRFKSGFENVSLAQRAKNEHQTLFSLVEEIIKQPGISIDTMGAYVVSETPFWVNSDE